MTVEQTEKSRIDGATLIDILLLCWKKDNNAIQYLEQADGLAHRRQQTTTTTRTIKKFEWAVKKKKKKRIVTKWYPFCFVLFCLVPFLTNNSRRNLSSSRAAGDVLFKCCWILDVPLLPPLMAKLFTEAATFAGFNAAPDVDIKFNGPRRSRRSSSSCLVSASTFATAKLSSFSFSLNKARIESRSLPTKEKTK